MKASGCLFSGSLSQCGLRQIGVFVIALTFTSFTLASSNTAVNGVAARAQGMQAFTAVADDASAIFYNPAGLVNVKGTEINSNILITSPVMEYDNSITHDYTRSKQTIPGGSLFISTDKLKSVALGLGIYAPFARSTNYSSNDAVYDFEQSATFVRMDAVPTVAFNLTPHIALGVGLVASRLAAESNVLGFKEKGEGFGYTGQAGLLLKLPQRINVGLTYRGRESIDMEGTGKFMGIKDHFDSKVHFPAISSLGIAWNATDALLLSFAYDYEMWSYLEKIERKYSDPLLNQIGTSIIDGQNKGTYRAGLLYKIKEKDELYAGYSYSPIAIPSSHIIPAKPDYDTQFFSVGASHHYENWRFDFTYEYDFGKEFTGTNAFFPGQYKAYSNVFLFGIVYTITS